MSFGDVAMSGPDLEQPIHVVGSRIVGRKNEAAAIAVFPIGESQSLTTLPDPSVSA